MNIHDSVTTLKFANKCAAAFKRLGIQTIADLLLYYPVRYEDYSQITDISALQEGDQTTIRGKVELIGRKRSFKRRTYITEAIVADQTDQLRVIWFGSPYITRVLKVGDEVFLSGKVKADMLGNVMNNPTYEKAKGHGTSTTHTARIVPLYGLTKGITHKQMRFFIKQAMDVVDEISEWLPDDVRDQVDVMGLSEALRFIHFPETDAELSFAQARLKFDELFVLQLRAEMIRQSQKRYTAPRISFNQEKVKAFVSDLPFELTKDQKIAAWDIIQDCQKAEPMNRLLEGNVGSGKTVVAALSMYNAFLSNKQSVMMAPTEILAKQHYESAKQLLGDEVPVALFTGKECINPFPSSHSAKSKKRAELRDRIECGEVPVVIGTHALLNDAVHFDDLGLTIVDEQHRFGVEQRKILREKSGDASTAPHFLSMSATPIPRSLALTLYGDLDISIIKQMPPGRKIIKTRFVECVHREKAYQFIAQQMKRGRQGFVVCARIGEDGEEVTEKKSVLTEYEKLSKEIFPDFRIAYLHGKMKKSDKDEVMESFKKGGIDMLVSTSVIEVGVNIPNATVMMIEDAERFGLAQLHQFRGRVGRSDHQSYCFVFTDSDVEEVVERLSFFEKNTNGFSLAEYDLKRRGPGDVYGTAQSGAVPLRFASLADTELIQKARALARDIDFDAFPTLRERVRAWEHAVHLE